jgi:hypothetical protein
MMQMLPYAPSPSSSATPPPKNYGREARRLCRALLTSSFEPSTWSQLHPKFSEWEVPIGLAPGAVTVSLLVKLNYEYVIYSTKVLKEGSGGHPTQAVILREQCWAVGGSTPKCCRLR